MHILDERTVCVEDKKRTYCAVVWRCVSAKPTTRFSRIEAASSASGYKFSQLEEEEKENQTYR